MSDEKLKKRVLNEIINDWGDCRTAQATPVLLNIYSCSCSINLSQGQEKCSQESLASVSPTSLPVAWNLGSVEVYCDGDDDGDGDGEGNGDGNGDGDDDGDGDHGSIC